MKKKETLWSGNWHENSGRFHKPYKGEKINFRFTAIWLCCVMSHDACFIFIIVPFQVLNAALEGGTKAGLEVAKIEKEKALEEEAIVSHLFSHSGTVNREIFMSVLFSRFSRSRVKLQT
jgi:hypothetical protein